MRARIETKRLILRNFCIEDANSMFETYCHDEVVTKYITWYPHQDVEYTKSFLSENVIPKIEQPDNLSLAITFKDDESFVIGDISIVSFDEDNVEIGYVIGRDYWNQGIASETVNAFCDYIYSHFDIKTIIACIDNENTASRKVLEKCGFTYSHQKYERRKFDSNEHDIVMCSYYMKTSK